MKTSAAAALVLLGTLAPGGCSSGGQTLLATTGFGLTVTADSTFDGPDGGMAVTVALVRGGAVEQEATDTVADSGSPAFRFTFPGSLIDGESYDVDYWIDTNIGGGTAGTCDSPPIDQVWQVPLDNVGTSAAVSLTYDPNTEADVCSVFNP